MADRLKGEVGSARLRLLVHPDVGPLDPATVGGALIAALSNGSGAERVMGSPGRKRGSCGWSGGLLWQTDSGKVLHLHVGRHPPNVRAGVEIARRAPETSG